MEAHKILISKEITIAMGHSVTNHRSKCRGLHGHDYRIIATVEGEPVAKPGASDEGMVIDFSDLKKAMIDVIDRYYDHGFVLYEKDPRATLLQEATELWSFEKERFHLVPFIPTAENLSKYWFDLLKKELFVNYNIWLTKIEVFETPTSSAIYHEGLRVNGDLYADTVNGGVMNSGEICRKAYADSIKGDSTKARDELLQQVVDQFKQRNSLIKEKE